MFGDGEIVTDTSGAGGTNGAPFQFNADTVSATPANGEAADLAFAEAVEENFGSGNTGLNFRVDLGRMAERLAGREAPTLHANQIDGADTLYQEEGEDRRVIPWVTGRYVDFSDGSAVDRDGGLWTVTSGVTVKLGKSAFAGAFGRYRQGDVSSVALDSDLDSQFYGGGAFVQFGSGDDLKIKLGGLYEVGQNDIVTAGETGSFDTTQWTIEGQAEKRMSNGQYWMTPAVSVLYAGLERDAYTDSGSNDVAASSQELGRLTYGSDFGVAVEGSGGVMRTFTSINGIWTFERADDVTLTTGEVLTTEEHSISLGGGFEYVATGGGSIRARGDWFTSIDEDFFNDFDFDEQLTGWTLSGGFGVPLATMFGQSVPGQFNLDMSGNMDAASTRADLTVPLN